MANAPINPATLFSPKPVLSGLAGLSASTPATPASTGSSPAQTLLAWAARLHMRDAAGLWDLRLVPKVEAALAGEYIWLRGPAWSEQTAAILGSIPSAHWYEAQPGGRLREISHLLPTGRLPQLAWLPLHGALIIEPPTAALPARLPAPGQRVPLELQRSTRGHAANLMIIEPAPWREFIENAPEVRFQGPALCGSA